MIFPLYFYQISAVINSTASFFLAMFVFVKSYKSFTSRIFGYFCVCIGLWQALYFKWLSSDSSVMAEYYIRTLMLVVVWAPAIYLHFIFLLINKLNYKKMLLANYCISLGISFSVYSKYFADDLMSIMVFPFWLKARFFMGLNIAHFFAIVAYAQYLLWNKYRQLLGAKRKQLFYVLLGTSLALLNGATNYLAWYQIPIPPVGNFVIPIYVILISYSIKRYELLNIRLVITNLTIFLFTYLLVLSGPLLLFYIYNKAQVAIWTMLAFATSGPYVYRHLQKKAEQRILQEEINVQKFLAEISYRMTTIKYLQQLFDLIVSALKRSLGIRQFAFYLQEHNDGDYSMVYENNIETAQIFKKQNPISEILIKEQFPIIAEAVQFGSDYINKERENDALLRILESIPASVVVPIFRDEKLIGFIMLGNRKNKQIYSRRILTALSVLGNQAGLAVENCRLWEAERRRMEEEGFQQRIASLDMVASSFAHEIDNPMGVISTNVDLMADVLQEERQAIPEKVKSVLLEAFGHVQEASRRVTGIVRDILNYSRIGSGEFSAVDLKATVEDALSLLSPQVRQAGVRIDVQISDTLPPVLGNRIQLEEIFMNLAANALHAVQGKTEKMISLQIFLQNNATIRIEFRDNGYGIPCAMIRDIFLASVTTKGSSEGTGLGLFRVRKIVDLHNGRIWAESEGEGRGAVFIVELPAYCEGREGLLTTLSSS